MVLYDYWASLLPAAGYDAAEAAEAGKSREWGRSVLNEKKGAAPRNRTIRLTAGQEKEYLGRSAVLDEKADFSAVADKIILGDCFDMLSRLPDKFADLLIADPPYNLRKTYGASKFRKMEPKDYEAYTRSWIEGALHTLKATASVYVCCDWETSAVIGAVLPDYFIVRNRITWQREKGRGAYSNWKNSMEDIWFATVSRRYTFNAGDVKLRRRVIAPYRVAGKPKDWQETESGNFRDTYPSNFWDDISVPYWSMPENTDHPAQKPEKLYARLILASSAPGGVVLDPFCGTGTAAVTAKKLGRRYVCIEKEPRYCALAEKRLEMADRDISIQGYADNVFWERNSLSEQKKAARKKTEKNLPPRGK